MVHNLQIQSLTVLARQYWAGHKFAEPLPLTLNKHIRSVEKFGQDIDTLQLPRRFEMDLKLAILEFGKRELGKSLIKQELNLGTECHDNALRECLPKFLHDDLKIKMLAPGLRWDFPEDDRRTMVVDLFFALILQSPRDVTGAIKELWTSRAFSPIQSLFLDNFANIYEALAIHPLGDVLNQSQEACDASWFLMRHLGGVMYPGETISNETLPWFVFEVLDCDQRGRFFAMRKRFTMTREYGLFTIVWAQIFCHWPWQETAFDMYFARKKHLSADDIAVLKIVVEFKRIDESVALEAKMLPREASFYEKINDFLSAKLA